MKEEEFDAFLEHGIREYAIDRAQAGFWTEAEALDRSRKAHVGTAARRTPDPRSTISIRSGKRIPARRLASSG